MRLDEFLLTRIAEDEAKVWDWDSDARCQVAVMRTGSEPGYTTVACAHPGTPWVADGRPVADARHVQVLYDPARVLADCAAKRAIMAQHEHVPGCGCLHNDQGHQFGCSTCHFDQYGYVLSSGWCPTLRLLALPFAGHPDYDKAWRVDL